MTVYDINNLEIVDYHEVNATTNAKNADTESTDIDNVNTAEAEIDKNDDIVQTAFSSFYARCFCRFSCSEVCAGLGNGCERFCTSRSLLGSYVHQESI